MPKVTKSDNTHKYLFGEMLVRCMQPMTYCTKGNIYSAGTDETDDGIILIVNCDDEGDSYVAPPKVSTKEYFQQVECTPEDLETFIEFEILLCEDLHADENK